MKQRDPQDIMLSWQNECKCLQGTYPIKYVTVTTPICNEDIMKQHWRQHND